MKYDKVPKTLPKYVEKEVINEMLEAAKNHKMRNYIMLLTLWKTGIRASELINLKKIDIKSDCIEIRLGKGKKDRIVPLADDLSNILALFTDNMGKSDFLFSIGRRQLQNIVHTYESEGFNVHPHTMRHSFAVFCLKSGMNLRSLQKILGHGSLSTTAIYLDLVAKDVKDDFKKVIW